MASQIFNPDASPETTSVDGYVGREAASAIFATIRGGAGTGADDSGATMLTQIRATATTDQYDTLRHIITLFDTSALPENATITAADLDIYVNEKSTGMAVSYVPVAVTPASNTALATGDYAIANFGSTALATAKAGSALTVGAYNTWTLNASGLALISLSGITKLALILEEVRANTAPTWVSAANAYAQCDAAEATNKPKLTVTYTTPGGGQDKVMFFGIH